MSDVYVHSVNSVECSCGWKREDDWNDEAAVRRWGADA
jgi:hypothetical protein